MYSQVQIEYFFYHMSLLNQLIIYCNQYWIKNRKFYQKAAAEYIKTKTTHIEYVWFTMQQLQISSSCFSSLFVFLFISEDYYSFFLSFRTGRKVCLLAYFIVITNISFLFISKRKRTQAHIRKRREFLFVGDNNAVVSTLILSYVCLHSFFF
jgi:hypothetical protein